MQIVKNTTILFDPFYGYVSTTKYLHFGIAKNTKL